MSFPATDVSRIEKKSDDHAREITQRAETVKMVLTFMGLYGVNSPLPSYFSEVIATLGDESDEPQAQGEEDGIRALRSFLDMFNHRIYSLLYRSWKKYRYNLQFEADGEDDFSQYMLSLIGLGSPALQDLVGVEPFRLISYVGILGQRKRCAASLEQLLSDYFGGIDTRVTEFMPRWVPIPKEYQACLGGGGAQLRLGEISTIGDKIRDLAGKFRVVLAPMKFEPFRRLLPGGNDSQELYRLIRFYAPDQLSFDVKLLLDKDEVPPLQLGTGLAQLGWTSWLGKPQEEVVSIVFSYKE
jgi:type VI secretion system protein ImpH